MEKIIEKEMELNKEAEEELTNGKGEEEHE